MRRFWSKMCMLSFYLTHLILFNPHKIEQTTTTKVQTGWTTGRFSHPWNLSAVDLGQSEWVVTSVLLTVASSDISWQVAAPGWQLLLKNPPFFLFPPQCSSLHRMLFRKHTWKIFKISNETQMTSPAVGIPLKKWPQGNPLAFVPSDLQTSSSALNQSIFLNL